MAGINVDDSWQKVIVGDHVIHLGMLTSCVVLRTAPPCQS